MREAAPTFVRWLWIWITVGALVVVVVIGFLLGIVSSLESIDDGLLTADKAVSGAGGDVKPLPDHIQDINRNLTRIDTSLKPITGQADEILGSLRSIQGTLGSVDASLVDTSGSLVDTSGSLVDTSGQLGNITNLLVDTSGQLGTISGSLVDTSGTLGNVAGSLVDTSGALVSITGSLGDIDRRLISVRGFAGRIDNVLKAAQPRGAPQGTEEIWRTVRQINGGSKNGGLGNRVGGAGANTKGLEFVRRDADNILVGLQEVNKHLTSVCESPTVVALQTLAPLVVRPGPC